MDKLQEMKNDPAPAPQPDMPDTQTVQESSTDMGNMALAFHLGFNSSFRCLISLLNKTFANLAGEL